jgi:molybdopterin synthase sulfur carrier subunit
VSVVFHIPGALRDFTGGRTIVEIEVSSGVLDDALKALWARYPGIQDRIATEQGQIRQHINIFVGNENVRYTGGLATPIPAGSEISIVPAVSGGSPLRQPGTQPLHTGSRSTGKRKEKQFNAPT